MIPKYRRLSIIVFYPLAFLFLFGQAFQSFPWDYAINWTAALGLRQGVSLYDRDSLQTLGVQQIGPLMARLFDQPFTSYIGLPTTAMGLLPFSFLGFSTSFLIYRAMALFAFFGGIGLVALSLPEESRYISWLTGALCLIGWHAIVFSIALGQVDAWIVLALSISVLALQRGLWKTVGVCLGIATLLKISPGLLVLYCLLKRRWAVVWSAGLTILLGLALALVPQQGADLSRFIAEVAPSLSGSVLHVENQALGAWLARLTTSDVDLLSFTVGIGSWRFVGVVLALGMLTRLWWLRRDAQLAPAELSVVVIIALLAGPITWDHYTSWAIIPTMLLLPQLTGRSRALFIGFLVVLAFPVLYLPATVITSGWWVRIITGTQTLALLGMLSIALLFFRAQRATLNA